MSDKKIVSETRQGNKERIGKVAVIYGGTSAEREISLASGAAVLQGLLDAGVDAVGVDASTNLLSDLQALRPDRVFIALHGPGGEDGTVQGALECLGIPYTGSGVAASALAMDKRRCKQLWRGAGLPTAAFAVLEENSNWTQLLAELGGAAMVKPANEGSSLGMAKAETPDELEQAWRAAASYDASVIAEAWLTGEEYTVAIVGNRALPVIKLETDRPFYDYEAKYQSDDTRYICPCGLSAEREQELQQLALRAFESLGCQGWGRVDVMVDDSGAWQLLEVNTIPGMTDHSLVPMAARAAGLSFSDLVVEIVSSAELSTGHSKANAHRDFNQSNAEALQ
ncbi:MAG: D-alanine--D-alanine ligase [Porticoccaceae bacterium]|nr:D-alanine--D-alanine ligase [Porticoccaceae bacterium]